MQHDYVQQLEEAVRRRYLEKIKQYIGYDPYNVNKSDFSRDIHDLPAIQAIDLSCYLVHQTSYYTAKQMKAKKSLEAYDYFTNGWVNLLGTKAALDNHQVVFAKVSVAGLDSY